MNTTQDGTGAPRAATQPSALTRSTVSRSTKRAVDLALVGMLSLIASPLLLLIALAIKVSSRGPVLFKHRRVGRNGEQFNCLKFRTMYADRELSADELDLFEQNFKLTDDPRVTSVGRILRATSLDELPQLWNILRGAMSLVGPRPLIVEELQVHYSAEQRQRLLAVRPGLTGPWQVSGPPRTEYPERVEVEAGYGANATVRGDLTIVLKTVRAVLMVQGSG